MALPKITSYPMPAADDLPLNKVKWKPNPDRAVLLIHDMQQYFIDAFEAEQSPVVELIANINSLRKFAAEVGIPVIYTAQPGAQGSEERGLLQDFWGSGVSDDPGQTQIVRELAPSDSDKVLTKWRYNAFRKTNLFDYMRQLGRDQIIICGVYAHIGCLLTACDAFMQDIETFFVTDALADFSLNQHMMALAYAAELCAVIVPTDTLLHELSVIYSGEKDFNSELITYEQVREHIADMLQIDPSEITGDGNLIYMGLDSVRIMMLVEKWRQLGIEVSFAELAERPTLSRWWDVLMLYSCPK